MKRFSLVAAIVLAAFCTSTTVAQNCGCDGNVGYVTTGSYAASAQYGQTYAQPMMTSYASQGCSGCYNTSIAPAVSYGSGCESSNACCNRGWRANRNRCCDTRSTGCYTSGCNTSGCGNTSGCSGYGQTYASMPVSNGNCGTYAAAPVSAGNCGSSGTYTSGSNCGNCCGSSTYAMNRQVRRGCGSYNNRGSWGSNYGSYNNCGGGAVPCGGQITSGGCGDCISGSVPAGTMIQGNEMNQEIGTPVPSADSDVEPGTATPPPSPEDT